MRYEKAYQETAHNHLCTDEDYYLLRATAAFKDYFRKNRDYLSGKRILDWGCGLGQNIYHLNGMHYQVAGYDTSDFAVEFCKKKGIPAVTKLPRGKGEYDVIFCRHVLEHLHDPYDTLKEMVSHLKTGGVLDLIVPCERHNEVSFKPDHNGHIFAWNFRCINNLLAEMGLQVIKNEILVEGDGYYKLKSAWLAKIAGYVRGCRELRIVGMKK